MGNLFSGWHLLLILVVILLLFGAAKLPALAKGLGQSARVFKSEMKAMKDESTPDTDDSASPDAPASTPSNSAEPTHTSHGDVTP